MSRTRGMDGPAPWAARLEVAVRDYRDLGRAAGVLADLARAAPRIIPERCVVSVPAAAVRDPPRAVAARFTAEGIVLVGLTVSSPVPDPHATSRSPELESESPERNPAMMRVSEALIGLAQRAKAAEDAAEAARLETRDQLVARVATARAEAEDLAGALRDTAISAEQEAVDQWAKVQQAWREHTAATRARIADRQAERDAGVLTSRARYAQDYALAATAMAMAAVQEAQYAALDAALARADAQTAAHGGGDSPG